MNAAREQIIINTRLTSIGHAMEVLKINSTTAGPATADKLLEDAAKVEAYLLSNIEAVKPKSSIVLQTQMPPKGMFQPGD